MKFIDLVSSIKIVTLDTPISNLFLNEYVNKKDEEKIKEIINFFLTL